MVVIRSFNLWSHLVNGMIQIGAVNKNAQHAAHCAELKVMKWHFKLTELS